MKDDLISRQVLLNAIKKLEKSAPTAQHLSAIFDCEDAIVALPSAQQWIPCKERLPEYDGEYMVTKKTFGWNCEEYAETDIARYEKKNGWHKADQVIAWMPLPEPYKEHANADHD